MGKSISGATFAVWPLLFPPCMGTVLVKYIDVAQRRFSNRQRRLSSGPLEKTLDHTTHQISISARRWWILLVVSIVLLIATYVLAVLTATGQGLENTALRGADQASPADSDEAWESLGNITIWSLGIATAIIGLIGLLRRKFILAVVGMGVIVGGQVITQALKRFILPRPELVEVTGDYTHNSFPSGHTTIAMTVLVAVLLVVPYRWRGWYAGGDDLGSIDRCLYNHGQVASFL